MLKANYPTRDKTLAPLSAIMARAEGKSELYREFDNIENTTT